ncbi:MAG TPA: translation initiation factor IF-3 [Thiotrichaceae bacterium]|nr:translation initiation factor IF-3 [Thiotrichaceae bacterium]
MTHEKQRTRLNQAITAPQVRLIAVDGQQIGIVSSQEAQEKAQEVHLDLVEIVPNAKPPVCRIMDYGKFLFEENKKRNKAKKKQKQVQLKEIKFRPSTEEGDYQVKLRNLIRFLEEGDKAKITLRFRGREMAHRELGFKLLNRLKADLSQHGTIEQEPKMEGRQMAMVFGSNKK